MFQVIAFGHGRQRLVIQVRDGFGELDSRRASSVLAIATRQDAPRFANRDNLAGELFFAFELTIEL